MYIVTNPYNSFKVTIIILSYNGDLYIEETINSAIKQSYKNIEIIIIDDHSKSETVNKILHFNENPKIQIFLNKENKGITYNLNKVVLNLDSDFFLLLGHDDIIPANHVETMLSEFDDETISVHCNSYIIDSLGKKKKLLKTDSIQQDHSQPEKIFNALAIDNFISSCGMLHRTKIFKLVKGWEPKYKNYGEWLYYINSLKFGHIKYTTKTIAFYRIHETNITKTFNKKGIKNDVISYKNYCRHKAFKLAKKNLPFLIRYLFIKIKSRY
ncbi:Spore coat polysaccharide biosynthesis protein spsA [Providencia alcalifaciens]|uniref:Glycosyltransferase, group 2 family protein n=1 Tax=Providencia alcalifaciens DSM 30120 TaxID=520999 RepID=B6XJS6_9GAMM|nr:glycosyltransferase [Providencia alcalifaciens]EEB44283.1 glycosyltransferase, group 2 family protein [Providencia alcalifaciens DSM 30120]SQI43144.1 Spore coat polysaccharide biosynthesis protein spsA [Providencia alcalifaciens]